ncbi:MAG: serine hydrolase domain-containing protein [Bacteroidota bacterium]
MRKLILYVFVVSLWAVFPFTGWSQDVGEKVAQVVERAAYYEVSFKKIPGISIAVYHEDSTFFFDYGEKVKGVDQSPDPNTVYEISSVTKVFTATLVNLLDQDGVLDLDDPVEKYIEDIELRFEDQPVRIRHLLNHTAGLPKQPFNFGSREKDPSNPYAFYAQSDLKHFLQQYNPVKAPGNEYQYSHVGYAILEWIIELASNESYETLLQRYIFQPIGLTSTSVDLNENMLARLAQGYDVSGDPTKPWNFMTYAGALGLKSTTQDLIRFAEALLNEQGPYHPILLTMLEETVSTPVERVEAGMAWHLAETRKNFPRLVLHSGVSDGYQAYLAIIPEKKTAIAVLSNSEHSQKGLGGFILQLLFNNFKGKPLK